MGDELPDAKLRHLAFDDGERESDPFSDLASAERTSGQENLHDQVFEEDLAESGFFNGLGLGRPERILIEDGGEDALLKGGCVTYTDTGSHRTISLGNAWMANAQEEDLSVAGYFTM